MNEGYDVIIIGGSYAGLSAAMALGRALRRVMIIDSNNPCNKYAPAAHNFITHDGKVPEKIREAAKAQVLAYETVEWLDAKATDVIRQGAGFRVYASEQELHCRKLIFTTGLTDVLPDMEGFTACWGVSVLHCPYCHGYEVRGRYTGILINGEMAYEMCQMLSNWTSRIVLLTNGPAALSEQQLQALEKHNIRLIETPVKLIEHEDGHVRSVRFSDGTSCEVEVIYARPPFKQQCTLPLKLGCYVNDHGLIRTDLFQKTCLDGVYAAGDNSTLGRSIAGAVANGNLAGIMLNKELISEDFGE